MRKKKSKLKVINLFGAPGMGKSGIAGFLFGLMKAHHMSVEQVSEYAKYLVLTKRTWQLKKEQLYLLAKQHHKQLILQGKYEFAVTDSPLQLCSFYAPKGYVPSFKSMVDEVNDEFDNINFFLSRDLSGGAPFELEGRVHDREASLRVEQQMLEFLDKKKVPFEQLSINIMTPWDILERIAPGTAQRPIFPGTPVNNHSLILAA